MTNRAGSVKSDIALGREDFTEERIARLLSAVDAYEKSACEEGK